MPPVSDLSNEVVDVLIQCMDWNIAICQSRIAESELLELQQGLSLAVVVWAWQASPGRHDNQETSDRQEAACKASDKRGKETRASDHHTGDHAY